MAPLLGSASFSEASSNIRSKFNSSVNGNFFSRSFDVGSSNNTSNNNSIGHNISSSKQVKRNEGKRKERLTKLLHEYLAEEDKWLTKAQDYR